MYRAGMPEASSGAANATGGVTQNGNPAFDAWLRAEFEKIEKAFVDFDYLQLKELNVEPTKPRSGMLVLADGSNWNPGSGAGFYGYYGGSWSKLG